MIDITKRPGHHTQLRLLYFEDSDTISIYNAPLVNYYSSNNLEKFRSGGNDATIKRINDQTLIFQFSKPSGEIDEIYLAYENSYNSGLTSLDNYCTSIPQLKNTFNIPEVYKGLVYIVFDQKENLTKVIDDHLVFLTTESFDLDRFVCKNYQFFRKNKKLNLQWDKYRRLAIDSTAKPDGIIWGMNQGPYLEVLYKMDLQGEVLVVDIK